MDNSLRCEYDQLMVEAEKFCLFVSEKFGLPEEEAINVLMNTLEERRLNDDGNRTFRDKSQVSTRPF